MSLVQRLSFRVAGLFIASLALLILVPGVLLAQSAVAQSETWQRIGPYGGVVEALVAMPDGAVYAGTPYGLFRTDDQATLWHTVDTGFDDVAVTRLVGTVQGDLIALTTRHGLLRQGEEGLWESINEGLPDSTVVRALADGPQGKIYAALAGGEGGGVYLLEAGARAWVRVGLSGKAVVTIDVDQAGIILAGEEDLDLSGVFRIYRSTDGQTWTDVVITDQEKATTPVLAFSSDGVAYAGGYLFDYDVFIPVGVYKSLDGGQHWERVTQDEVYIEALFPGPEGQLFVSDGVLTLQLEEEGFKTVPFSMLALAFDAEGVLYAGGRRHGARRSRDGGATWEEATQGLGAAQVDDMVVDATGTFYALGGRFYRSQDQGATWTFSELPFPAPTFASTLLTTAAGHVFVQYAHTMHRSRDGGTTWETVSPPIDPGIVIAVPTCMRDVNGTLYVAGFNMEPWFFRSEDEGDSWQRLDMPPNGIAELGVGPNDMLLASERGGKIYRSVDKGETWQQVADLEETSVLTFGVGPTGTLFAGTSQGTLYRSADEGDTWVRVPFEHPDPEATAQAFFATGDSLLYMGSIAPEPLWRSSDDGLTWEPVSHDLPANLVTVRDFTSDDTGQLYAVASRAGLYKQVVVPPTDTAVRDDGPVPQFIHFQANYPNPFSRTTTLPFTLVQPAYVTLEVRDVLGRKVATLVDEYLPTGTHHIAWDAQSMPAGLYFARLQTDQHSIVQPLTLIR